MTGPTLKLLLFIIHLMGIDVPLKICGKIQFYLSRGPIELANRMPKFGSRHIVIFYPTHLNF